MADVQFIGRSRQNQGNVAAAPCRLVNCYREPVGDQRLALKAAAGLVAYGLTASVGRAMATVNGKPYVAAGGALYEVAQSGAATLVGAIPDDIGTVLDGYGQNVLIAADGDYLVYDGSTVAAVTGGAFTNVGSVCFLSGYAVLTERNGSKFEWTDLQDPTTRLPANVATAEARDDVIIRGIVLDGNLYLMGGRSIEIWSLTGLADADAFARLGGGVINRGLRGKNFVSVYGDGAFFVGDDGICYVLSGGSITPVSAAAVEESIATNSLTQVVYYEDRGRKMCVLRFSDRAAWCYDLTLGEWWERAQGNDLGPWGVLATTKAYDKWIALDAEGQLSTLERSNADLGGSMIRKAVSMVFTQQGERFIVRKVEARMRRGVLADAQIDLRMSRDGGRTWSPPKQRDIGGPGVYDRHVAWRNLGQVREATFELTIADAAEIPVYADMGLSIG